MLFKVLFQADRWTRVCFCMFVDNFGTMMTLVLCVYLLSLQRQLVHSCLTPIVVNIIKSVRHGTFLPLVKALCKLE